MRQTLLQIVQNILSDMSGDEVNSIYDTVESEKVARHVRSSFNAIVSRSNWDFHRKAVTLTPRSDNDYPTHMVIDEDIKRMISIRYNQARVGETRRYYKDMKYLEPDHFLMKLNRLNNDAPNVDVIVDDSGIELLIVNDKNPEYWTSFNDQDIVFDSYDASVDSSLQSSKVQAQAYVMPEFKLEDDYVPDLPVDAFSYLIEDATSRAQFKDRQIVDEKSETEAQRQGRFMSRQSWRASGGLSTPDYGRRR